MGLTAFPFDAVLDVTPNTLLGNDTATAAPAKALTTTQVRALLGVYTTAQVDALLSGKSDAGHTHAYSSLTGIPATFPPSAHNQAWSTITETPTTLAGYGITDAAASGHTHPQSDVTGLTSALAAKADLVGGLVPANQLPSFVDDVLEFANLAAFPGTGESGKIYVALDTSRTYRWGGSTYAELTDSTAVWGSISGVLANQTDLASALSGKSDTGHTHAYSSLTGIPSSFSPTAHKATHATGQPDAISPSDIGAVPTARTLTINGTALDLSADRSWTVSGGISSLNGLTDATQTFATGTTGTNFGIVSAAGVHTFNLPDASATARGVVTTGTQRFAGIKYFESSVIRLGAGANDIAISTYGSGTNTALYIDNNVGQVINFRCAASFVQVSTSSIEPHLRVVQGLSISNTFLFGGTNVLQLRNGAASQILQVFNTYTNGSNFELLALQFVTYASARYAQLACESAGTGIANMNLVLTPKGTGALIAGPMPDGTAVGGNARGANAIDLQTVRTAATQVAGATSSALIGTQSCGIASGATASAILASTAVTISSGVNCAVIAAMDVPVSASSFCAALASYAASISSVNQSVVLASQYATASRSNQIAFGSGRWAATGDRQSFWLTGGVKTTTNAAVEIDFGLGVANVPVYITLAAGRQISGMLTVQGIKSDGSVSARYCRLVTIRRVSNTTTLDDSSTVGTDLVNGTSLSVTADSTNHRLNVSPTGISGETWRWQAQFQGIEQAYGT